MRSFLVFYNQVTIFNIFKDILVNIINSWYFNYTVPDCWNTLFYKATINSVSGVIVKKDTAYNCG